MLKLHDFCNRAVLIVGGSSGIGRGIAQAFRQAGADVYVWGTRQSADDYPEEGGLDLSGIHYSRMDVSDFAAIEAFEPLFDRLDILVLSQGLALYGRKEFELENFRKVVDVNLTSQMACASKFYPMLAKSQGSLITITSTAAFHSTVGNPAYNASKTGAFGLTRTLGEAWAPVGIRVNGIAPGFVETKMTKVTTENPERKARTIGAIPLGRMGQPNEIAGAALFLASPLASYIVGQTIVVDGGYSLS